MAKFLKPVFFIVFFFLLYPRFTYAQNIAPQVTFGDILALQGSLQGQPLQMASDQEKLSKEKYAKIQAFLKIIEENGKKSLNDFNKNYPNSNNSESILGASSAQMANNIASFYITPVPTLHPELEKIIAQIPSNLGQGDLPAYATQQALQAGLTPLKSSYTIALLGDSMTDTLGENLPNLNSLLKQAYPKHNFVLLNYGQGSTNIEQGLFRLTNPTKYLNRDFPPLLHLQPDIIVIESFAYNHWGSELNDLNRQWDTAVQILETVKKYSAETKIILLATISPNPKIYGDGVLNWPEHLKWDAAITTKAYLQNFINFANSAYLPLADAYRPSLNSIGHGDPKYINASDHLHPSEEGKQLISQKIFETIKANNLIR